MTQKEAIESLKGMWNSTKEINGVKVRRRCWDNYQWQIVDSMDFKTANIIQKFYYQKEIANFIKNR